MSRAYREPSEQFPQPPDSTPDFAAMRAKSRQKALKVAVPAVVAVALIGAGATALSRRSAQQDFAAAAAGARGCLLEGALSPGETMPTRVRRLQVQAMGVPQGERFTAGAKGWPLVCNDDVRKALATAERAGLDGAATAPLTELAKRLDDPTSLVADLTVPITAAWATFDRAPAAPDRPTTHVLRPASWPLEAGTLADDFRIASQGVLLGHTFTEDNPGQTLPILVDEKDLPETPLLCSFAADAPEATCRSLGALKEARHQGLRLFGTSDPGVEPLVFAGRRGTEGTFTSAGDLVDTLYAYGGYADRNGNASVLGFDEKTRELVLARKPKGGATTRLVLKPKFRVGNYFYSSQILWDQVLVRGVAADEVRRLYVLPLAQADAQGFELADVGELPEAGEIEQGDEQAQQHLAGCRTSGMTVVRVHGYSEDYLSFRFGAGGFSKPIAVDAGGTLGCHGSTANLVGVQPDSDRALLTHDVCTSSGCVHTAFAREILDRNTPELKALAPSRIAAVDLMGKLLVVWSAGDNGGLRLRLGSPDTFEHAPDQVVFDDHWQDGAYEAASSLLGFRLFSRENVALLMLSTTRGLHVLRIDPDGKVTPWKVHHQG